MRKTIFLVISSLIILSMVLSACAAPVAPATGGEVSEQPAAAPATGELPRNETLYIAGHQWGPPTTFNPLTSGTAWPAGGAHMYIYESLMAFNQLTGDLDPLLAKSYEFTDGETLVVTLQDGTAWADGTPLTTDDVIYTYELAKTNSDINYSTLFDYITSITATDDRTLEIKLNPERLNPGMVKNFVATIKIMPKHVWQEREGGETPLSQIVEMEPLGSGAWKLMAQSPERIALERNDNYWGKDVYGLPAPKYFVHPIFKSNDDGNLALQRGEVDYSQQFVPQIWQMWEGGAPVGTWLSEEPYYIPGSIPILFINVQRPGLDNPLVRRALAYSINYPQIAATAMSRYSIPANASLIIPDGGEAKFFNADQVAELGWEYNPEKAVEILEGELGATKGSDGIYVLPDGTRLGPWTVRTPYGWTDWMTAVDVVVQNGLAVGFDLKSEFLDFPIVNSDLGNGNFDFNLWYIAGVSPSSPWQRFRDVMDDRGVPEPGQTAFWNYGRFSNPDVPALLDATAASIDEAEQIDLYGQLDKIFTENIPAIPLMYRPFNFYEFNETYWSGFPTAENPTAPPMHEHAGVQVLFQVQPVSQ